MTLSTNGRISLYCFVVGCTVLSLILLNFLGQTCTYVIEDYWFHLFAVYSICAQGLLFGIYKKRGYAYKIAWRACLLGSAFSLGVLTCYLAPLSWKIFGVYLMFLALFHYTEYLTTAIINPRTLSIDSFLLNHSKEYGFAAGLSFIEFVLERYFYPEMKETLWISVIGVLLCMAGESLRKAAMITAGSNFNHIIQSHREEGHVLVTHGIYAYTRHPSYVGWFCWSIGTQIILCNPICFVGYALASWKFFKHRVLEEEILLLNFFGEDYVNYQRKVCTGLPFIYGYRLEL